MKVPADVQREIARNMATRAIGSNVPAVDIARLEKADRTVGNEDILRGLPLFINGRMAKGCTMSGTRPGDRAKYADEVATHMDARRMVR